MSFRGKSFVAARHFSSALKGVAVAAALLSLAACSEEKKAEAPEIVRPVKVTQIGAPDEGRKLVYSGSVRARTEMNLGFRVAGKITERLVDVGDRVTPGEVLARIDSTDYKLDLGSAEADLASATKQVEISGLALRRAETLAAKDVTSKSQLEQAQLSSEQALAQRDSAQSALEKARNQVAYSELKSDRDGIVTAVSADRGQVVSTGTSVVTVAVDGEKEVQIAVPEMDVSHFKPGDGVKARIWSSADLVIDGKVREVAQVLISAPRRQWPTSPRISACRQPISTGSSGRNPRSTRRLPTACSRRAEPLPGRMPNAPSAPVNGCATIFFSSTASRSRPCCTKTRSTRWLSWRSRNSGR